MLRYDVGVFGAEASPLSREAESFELVNLYHLARIPLSGTSKDTKHGRMLWASAEYAKLHPETSATAAYKRLDRALYHGPA